jgi:hypothetical protein
MGDFQQPAFFMTGHDPVGCLPYLGTGVPHGNAESSSLDHWQIVAVIADSTDRFRWNAPARCQLQHTRPLIDSSRSNFAEPVSVPRAPDGVERQVRRERRRQPRLKQIHRVPWPHRKTGKGVGRWRTVEVRIDTSQLLVAIEVFTKAGRPASRIEALERPTVKVKALIVAVGIDHRLMACPDNGRDNFTKYIGRKTCPKQRAVVTRLLDEPPRGSHQRPLKAQFGCNGQDVTVAATGGQQHLDASVLHLPDCFTGSRRHLMLAVSDGAINVEYQKLKRNSHVRVWAERETVPAVMVAVAMIAAKVA